MKYKKGEKMFSFLERTCEDCGIAVWLEKVVPYHKDVRHWGKCECGGKMGVKNWPIILYFLIVFGGAIYLLWISS